MNLMGLAPLRTGSRTAHRRGADAAEAAVTAVLADLGGNCAMPPTPTETPPWPAETLPPTRPSLPTETPTLPKPPIGNPMPMLMPLQPDSAAASMPTKKTL